MEEIKIPEQLVNAKTRMDEVNKEKEKIMQEVRNFYNARKKGEAFDDKAINSQISELEKSFSDILFSLCKLGAHLYEKVALNMNWEIEKSEEHIDKSYIKAGRCVLCGEIIFVKKVTISGGSSHHIGTSKIYEEDIPEEFYKSKMKELPAVSHPSNKEILEAIRYYHGYYSELLHLEGVSKIAFEGLEQMRYYRFSKYDNSEILTLMQQFIDNNNLLEEFKNDKIRMIQELEEQNEITREELCMLFGHDIPSGKYNDEIVTCKCCNRRYFDEEAIADWKKAPLKGLLFKRPYFKKRPEVVTRIVYRDPNYKSPDDYNYYSD